MDRHKTGWRRVLGSEETPLPLDADPDKFLNPSRPFITFCNIAREDFSTLFINISGMDARGKKNEFGIFRWLVRQCLYNMMQSLHLVIINYS